MSASIEQAPSPWLHRFAVFTSAATLFLIFVGGLVTSTGSALAVPDWPLAYGSLFPRMVGGVFYEHGHRMVAATVGLLMTVLACWIFARERRRWVGWLAACALGSVVLQGVLGGITVLFLLPASVSVAHACLAQAFFCLTVTLSVVTGRNWERRSTGASAGPVANDGALRRLTVALTGAVYLQLILGAVMRHTGAGLAIPDFPLAFGRLIPPVALLTSSLVAIHFAHRVGALVVAALTIWTVARVLSRHRARGLLVRPAIVVVALLSLQIALGAFTIWTSRAVLPTTAHVTCGAALLAACLLLCLRAHRLLAESDSVGRGAMEMTEPAAADYVALIKPRVVVMILVATLAGFGLGARGSILSIDWLLLARTLFGTALVAGGALALNQYLERDIDALMRRTLKRPLPAGRMPQLEALAFGGALAGAGLLYLMLAVNAVSGLVTALTVISYLFLYTPMKRRTALCTVVGAFPGALPPLTGWTAAGGDLGAQAAVLFGILFFWQLPHSLAIAHLYREDYDRAGVKLLPTVDRAGGSTGRQTVLNCLALMAVGLLPTVLGLTGWISFMVALLAGGWLLWEGVALALHDTAFRARRLLLASYVYIPAVLITMTLDKTVT